MHAKIFGLDLLDFVADFSGYALASGKVVCYDLYRVTAFI